MRRTTPINLVDLKAGYQARKKEIDWAIRDVINSSSFILGPAVEQFEENFARFCQTRFAVGTDSGLSALELGIRSLGIGPGDEVITPANSFIASSSAISFTGAKPVWVDVDSKTYNINPAQIEKKINSKTKAIMFVHLYGQPAEVDKISAIAKRNKLFLIEDACQAHGAAYKGKVVGQFGDFAAFSFYPGKNLGAYGDAGILTTNNRKISSTVRQLRNYGQKKKYIHKYLAFNRRLDSIQAAILNVKLKYLSADNLKRRKAAQLYKKVLKDLPFVLPFEAEYSTHVYHQFVVQVPNRDKLFKFLQRNEILAGIHYPKPIHLQEAYRFLNAQKGQYPVSESLAKKIISLPIYPEISQKQIEYVSKKVHQFYS